MKLSCKRTISAFLCVLLLLTCLPVTASAAEDYRSWSQSDSRWGSLIMGDDPKATVAGYGCTSVSITKLLRQAGAVDDSYTPKTFVNAMNKAGNYRLLPDKNSGAIISYSVAAKQGEGFSFVGAVNTSKASVVVNYVKSGYYAIISGETDEGDHFCAVDNEMTLRNGYLTIMNSWKKANNVNVKWSKVFNSLKRVLLFKMKTSYTYTKIPTGTYYLKNAATGTYLSVDSDKSNVCVADFTGASSMQIEITNTGSGRTMRPLSTSKLINPYADYVANNVNVNLYMDAGDNSQKWYFERTDAGYLIRNKTQPQCVLATDGTNVEVQAYTGSDAQIWSLELVDPKAVSLEAQRTDTGISYTITPNFNSGLCNLLLASYENGRLTEVEQYYEDLEVINTGCQIKGEIVCSPEQTVTLFLLDEQYAPLCQSVTLNP